MPTTPPQPEEYATRAEYAWVRKLWKRSHGGSLIVTLAIAFIFGAWTGSQVLLWLLVAFAVVAHIVARNRP